MPPTGYANAFTWIFNYKNTFFGDNFTNIGLVWVSRDGEPFAYTYERDVNGDDIWGNDLFYVPNVDEYVLSNGDADAFEAFLSESGLDAYRGQIAPRNSFKTPRVNQWDLKIKQELPDWGFGRATLFFSVRNLGNLLNSDWGQVYTGRFDGVQIAELDGFDADGNYVLDWNERSAQENLFLSRVSSQWSAQVGFRFDW
jgi:hypothetical protein